MVETANWSGDAAYTATADYAVSSGAQAALQSESIELRENAGANGNYYEFSGDAAGGIGTDAGLDVGGGADPAYIDMGSPYPDTATGGETSSIGDPTGASGNVTIDNLESEAESSTSADPPVRDDGSINSSMTAAQLVELGLFKSPEAPVENLDYEPLADGKAPRVEVKYQNADPDAETQVPNFVVKRDGTIEMLVNPDGPPPPASIIVELERGDQATDPPSKEQQTVTDKLVTYLAERITDQYGDVLNEIETNDGSIKAVPISDRQGLVTAEVKQKFGMDLPPEVLEGEGSDLPSIPDDVQTTSNNMNRMASSGGGNMSVPADTPAGHVPGDGVQAGFDRLVPPRTVPQLPDETDQMAALKDTVAAIFNPDKENPYQTIRQNPAGEYQLGRYGLSQENMYNWISYLSPELLALLGDPPDWSKLKDNPELMKKFQEAMKKGLQKYAEDLRKKAADDGDEPPEIADKIDDLAGQFDDAEFAQGFTDLVANMDGQGEEIDTAAIEKYLSPEMQEVITGSLLQQTTAQLGADEPGEISAEIAGKAALSHFLGRTVTDADLSNSQYADFVNSASNMYKAAEQRNFLAGDVMKRAPNGATLHDGAFHIPQNDMFSCGATSLLMAVADWNGFTPTEEDHQNFINNTPTKNADGWYFNGGTDVMGERANALGGLSSEAGHGWEQLNQQLLQGRSAIVNGDSGLGTGHFVYVAGIQEQRLSSGEVVYSYIVGDPAHQQAEVWTADQLRTFMYNGGGWQQSFLAVWKPDSDPQRDS